MISKKKGILCMVIVIFLVLLTPKSLAEDNEWKTCDFVGDEDEDCDDSHRVECESSIGECGNEIYGPINKVRSASGVGSKGCPIVMAEDDYDDDCGIAFVPTGHVIDYDFSDEEDNYWNIIMAMGVFEADEGGWSDGDGDWWMGNGGESDEDSSDPYDAAACHDNKIALEAADTSMICGPEGVWWYCDKSHEDIVVYGDPTYPKLNYVFKCVEKSDDVYSWEGLVDNDKDGYYQYEDCNDDTLQDSLDCPESDEDELSGLTLEEAREKVKALCTYPQNNLCAICINPGAPEVCGDKVNNDCGGPSQYEDLTQLEGKTSDDCNKNQFACRQEAPPLDNTEDNATGITQTNIYGETFAWLDTADGGYCCGYNGIDDLGKTNVSSTGEGQFLCLNTNPELVGRDAEYTFASPFCGDEWCWVSNSSLSEFS